MLLERITKRLTGAQLGRHHHYIRFAPLQLLHTKQLLLLDIFFGYFLLL